jgi:hypothetical protein
MSDKIWKTEEIQQLCPPIIVGEAEIYIKAIKNKIDRIIFLVQRLSLSSTSIPRSYESTALRSSQLEAEIYIESIATNLHSLVDVLAHVINVIVLKPLHTPTNHLDDRKVSMITVKNKLSSLASLNLVERKYITRIIQEIDKLIESNEFKYISAFVNTIKHRSLLDTEFAVTVRSGILIDMGYRLDPFNYGGNDFPRTQFRVVAMDYREKIIDLVFDVGNSINSYCCGVALQQRL